MTFKIVPRETWIGPLRREAKDGDVSRDRRGLPRDGPGEDKRVIHAMNRRIPHAVNPEDPYREP